MKVLLGYLLLYTLGTCLFFCTHLTINVTPSLPYHGFFCVKGMKVKRGDLVCLKGHETCFTPDVLLTKRLVGLPGDLIEIRNNQLLVAGQYIGKLYAQTADGRPLTPLKPQKIPKGFVFLSADHPRSFDSRYEEFGLVDERFVQGRCFGLFHKECRK